MSDQPNRMYQPSVQEQLKSAESHAVAEPHGCHDCGNRCMDMDLDPYCAAVNKPWGQTLCHGRPAECGEANKLWELDTRARSR